MTAETDLRDTSDAAQKLAEDARAVAEAAGDLAATTATLADEAAATVPPCEVLATNQRLKECADAVAEADQKLISHLLKK